MRITTGWVPVVCVAFWAGEGIALPAADDTPTEATPQSKSGQRAWERVCATPDGYVPQGLKVSSGRLYLSAHQHDQRSALFELDLKSAAFSRLFELPPEATHTSGIAFHPVFPELLFAVDYHSNRIYAIDFPKSVHQKKAVVVASADSGLKGTSACCFVDLPDLPSCLLVSDFRNSSQNYLFRFDRTAGSIAPIAGLKYRNPGFSQGLIWHRGYVFETGNSLFSSYVVMYDLQQALEIGRVVPLRSWSGPDRLIEDIAFLDGHAYVGSEGLLALYRMPMDDSVFSARPKDAGKERERLRVTVERLQKLLAEPKSARPDSGAGDR